MKHFTFGFVGLQLQERPHPGQHCRINPIRFGQRAGPFGETTRLTRVDPRKRQIMHCQVDLK